ncbi:MAG: alpha/beta hydrolase, partial [Gammaproteobacteria bacterium]|nr:alpha/beta hydrolase [Gammaproteobacteria bacterium]
FPDAWFGWEAQLGPLLGAGFRVIVPSQRGYNLSDKPNGVANYKMDILVEDILGLADALGYERFHLAGHDFGAMVSWNLARKYPERVKKLVIANVPHPIVMKNYLRTHPRQILKSWYAFFFQLPALPELAVKANNWQFLINAMPKDFSAEERDRYRETWAQPGAMTGMINWYRASLRDLSPSTEASRIQVPTLMLWGQQDPHISYEMAPLSIDLCEDGRLITYEDATHWVLHDKSAEVSREMVAFFSAQEKE